MTIAELQDHIGGLIRIKTKLYWYETYKWDETHEMYYILLDVKSVNDFSFDDDAVTFTPSLNWPADQDNFVLHLLFSGSQKFVLTNEKDIEIVK